ncbi:MAG TPA: metal ABC transporter substrate-binding protein, partial [Alphaproteobacteria bacterium]|nr:metal ABC transporter substrate-binding protein [Alphaproteobacteria bacterium]
MVERHRSSAAVPSSISEPRVPAPRAGRWSLPALALALTLLGAVSEANAGTPRVVASIAPLHALISDVMSGLGSPALLVPANQSPHGYALRPSDMLALSEADLIVWIGPGLDGAVGRAVRSLKPDAVAIEAVRLDGLTLHKATFDHGQDEGTMDGEPPEHGVVDPHLWLDPLNAIVLVDVFAATLAEIDRDHAAQYEENALALKERLRALDARLRARLAPVARERYVVFHSAYRYLERRYGLEGGIALTIDP